MSELPPPPPPSSSTVAAPPEPVSKKKQTRKQKIAANVLAGFGLLTILFIIIGVITALIPAAPVKHAKWQADIKWEISEIVDPSTIKVWVTTKNVGQAAAVPDCSISLHSSYSDDFGYETFTIKRLAPGHEQTWNALVSINNHGARHITQDFSKVTCVDTQ